jgi:hypothetical protein
MSDKKECVIVTKRRFIPVVLFTVVCMVVSLTALAQSPLEWQLKSIAMVPDNPALEHVIWQNNANLDRIELHRVVNKRREQCDRRKVILMLPGTWQAGGWSELTDPAINPMIYLADNGYDVYTMSYRSGNIPDMDYDQLLAGGLDIFPVTDWTYGVFREDIKACVEKIKTETRAAKIFMSGFSRGATLMFIYANKYQNDLKGLVSLDGVIKDNPPTGTPVDQETYQKYINAFKAGVLPDQNTGNPVPWLHGIDIYNTGNMDYDSWKLAGVLPHSKKMAGASLPDGLTTVSDLMADQAYNLWGAGLLTNYYEHYIAKDVLVKVLNECTRDYPVIQLIEDLQLAAYDDVPYLDYDDNVVNLPALAFLTRFNCPDNVPPGDDIPNMTISNDVTIKFLSGYGHMDVMYGAYSLQDVKRPMLEWLNEHVQ